MTSENRCNRGEAMPATDNHANDNRAVRLMQSLGMQPDP